MRAALALAMLVSGCQQAAPEGAELTHAECADLVRRVQRIQSADTGGMRLALTAALRPGIEGCLEKGTQRAYRCVLQAEGTQDLDSCDLLFK